MQEHTYRIDPIRAESALEPELADMLEGMPSWPAEDWKDLPGRIIGWRLTLAEARQAVEQRDFEGGDEGFNQAQEAGRAWLAANGADDTSQWVADSLEAIRRMNYDSDLQHRISKKGF